MAIGDLGVIVNTYVSEAPEIWSQPPQKQKSEAMLTGPELLGKCLPMVLISAAPTRARRNAVERVTADRQRLSVLGAMEIAARPAGIALPPSC